MAAASSRRRPARRPRRRRGRSPPPRPRRRERRARRRAGSAAASHAFLTRFTSARFTSAASACAGGKVPATETSTAGVRAFCSAAISRTRAATSQGAVSRCSGLAKKRKSPVTRATCSASCLDRLEVPRALLRVLGPRREPRPAEDRARGVAELVRDARGHLSERGELSPGGDLALELPRLRPVLDEEERAEDVLPRVQDRDRDDLEQAPAGVVAERELGRERRRPGPGPLGGGRERGDVRERLGGGTPHVPGPEIEHGAGRAVRLREEARRVDHEKAAGMRADERLGRHRERVGAPLLGTPELLELHRAVAERLEGPRERLGRPLGLVARGAGNRLGHELAGPAGRLRDRVDRRQEAPQERDDEDDEDGRRDGDGDEDDARVAPHGGDVRVVPRDAQDQRAAGERHEHDGAGLGRAHARLADREVLGSEARGRVARGGKVWRGREAGAVARRRARRSAPRPRAARAPRQRRPRARGWGSRPPRARRRPRASRARGVARFPRRPTRSCFSGRRRRCPRETGASRGRPR